MREQRRTRRGGARRSRAEICWGHGRRLVVVDVENVAGGTCRTADAAAWAQRRLRDVGAVRETDHVAVAVDGSGLAAVAFPWAGARCLEGHGRDGADLVLLEVLADRVPQRYDQVVLASGDGIFAEAVAGLVARGVHVTVVAHGRSLSARLRAVASAVVLLSPEASTPPTAA